MADIMNNEERVLPIKITDNATGKVYELDFCRESIRFAEAREFDFINGIKQPMAYASDLFYYSFRMHHKEMSKANTDKLIEKMRGLSAEFINRLRELYAQAMQGNAINTDEDYSKNAEVTVEM